MFSQKIKPRLRHGNLVNASSHTRPGFIRTVSERTKISPVQVSWVYLNCSRSLLPTVHTGQQWRPVVIKISDYQAYPAISSTLLISLVGGNGTFVFGSDIPPLTTPQSGFAIEMSLSLLNIVAKLQHVLSS